MWAWQIPHGSPSSHRDHQSGWCWRYTGICVETLVGIINNGRPIARATPGENIFYQSGAWTVRFSALVLLCGGCGIPADPRLARVIVAPQELRRRNTTSLG